MTLCTIVIWCLTTRVRRLCSAKACLSQQNSSTTYGQAQADQLLDMVYLPNLLTSSQCQTLISAAELIPWQTARHATYATTDIATSTVPHIERALIFPNETIMERACAAFGFEPGELWLRDQFVVKYDLKGQKSLSAHRDASCISYVLALNEDYGGGGLAFADRGTETSQPRKLQVGEAIIFCGKRLHEGLPVTEGTRYIVTGFLDAHPSPQTILRIVAANENCVRRVIGHQQLDLRSGMVPTRPYLRSNTLRLLGREAVEAGDISSLAQPDAESLWPYATLTSVVNAAKKILTSHGSRLGEAKMHKLFHHYLTYRTECSSTYCHMES